MALTKNSIANIIVVLVKKLAAERAATIPILPPPLPPIPLNPSVPVCCSKITAINYTAIIT